MNSVKIVHTADLHLIPFDNITDKYRKQYANDALQVFYSIVDFCKDYAPDFLFISGDLFSTPKIPDSFASQIFEKFKEIYGTKVFISPGNHDYLTSSSAYKTLKLPENVYIFSEFSKVEFKEKNANIYGFGFNERYVKSCKLSPSDDESDINICVIHGDALNAKTDYNPISENEIKKSKFDYIALGHIHAFSGIKTSEKVAYAYPGTPQGQGFDELGPKGFIFGEILKDKLDLKFKNISIRTFEEFEFKVSETDSPANIAKNIALELKTTFGENFSNNSYKIIITGNTSQNQNALKNYILENLKNYVFYAEIIDKTKPSIEALKELAIDGTIKGVFIKKILEKIENCDPEQQEIVKKALYIGLEVLDNDN